VKRSTRTRKLLKNEKACPVCVNGVMYLCKFEDGKKCMVCDMCANEKIIKEKKECTKGKSVVRL
jgi:hypothetical protein